MASTGARVPSDRFLPPDPRVEEPYRFTPQLALRIGILGALALAVFAILFLRLWALQVLSGTKYRSEAQNNQLRTVRVEAPRGAIRDRAGRLIVANAPGTAVRIWPADLPEERRYHELRRLAKILDVPFSGIVADIEKRRGDPLTPVIVQTNVDRRRVLYLLERRDEFPGVQVAHSNLRRYPHGTLAAHLLGHVTEIAPEQLKQRRKAKEDYRAGDRVGQGGVEGALDAYLRGRPGLAQLRVDSLGRPRSALVPRYSPSAGHSVRLTLDLHVQRAAERSLEEWVTNARAQDCIGCWAANGGAIVAMDARDGAIRAMASFPTFNPSLYTGRVNRRELESAGLSPETAEGMNWPGINKAALGQYPAGSTFKPLTALAAMQERLISPYDLLECTPDYEVAGQVFNNWTPMFTAMNVATALEYSCDTFFYRLGHAFYRLPEERGQPLQAWARKFGFGEPTGLDIGGEASGLIPTIKWRRATYTKETDPCCWEVDRLWKPGDSIQLAIGQKDMTVTPLQMARFYSFIANGGKLVTPHLAMGVEQSGRGSDAIVRSLAPPPPAQVNVDPTALGVVREGLFRATHGTGGTSTAVFGSFPVAIAGKTGTAQKAQKLEGWLAADHVDQSWWCGYGPADDAELVVCAIIENGGFGGAIAAPAALRVFEEYFGHKSTFVQPEAAD